MLMPLVSDHQGKIEVRYTATAEHNADHMGIPLDEAHEILAGLQADSLCPKWDWITGSVVQ